jgi:hypothetical protein
MSPSMTKFHGYFCNVRQIFYLLHIFLIKKYFSVNSSVFDKTRPKQKYKQNITTLRDLRSLVWMSRIAKKCNVRQFVLSHMRNNICQKIGLFFCWFLLFSLNSTSEIRVDIKWNSSRHNIFYKGIKKVFFL